MSKEYECAYLCHKHCMDLVDSDAKLTSPYPTHSFQHFAGQCFRRYTNFVLILLSEEVHTFDRAVHFDRLKSAI